MVSVYEKKRGQRDASMGMTTIVIIVIATMMTAMPRAPYLRVIVRWMLHVHGPLSVLTLCDYLNSANYDYAKQV